MPLPNSITRYNFADTEKVYQFPSAESQINLKAMFLPGYKESCAEERIKIIATKQKEELLPLGFRKGLFQAYDAKSTGMISDPIKRLNHIEPSEWSEATATYILSR